MKNRKKILISLLLAAFMTFAMTISAFAANGYNTNDGSDASAPLSDTASFTFTKHYALIGDTENGTSPSETFTVKFAPYAVANIPASAAITTANMPAIADAALSASAGAADTDSETNVTAAVTLPQYTAVGDYWYKVTETAGSTAGVEYDDGEYYLHVQVISESDALIRLVTLHTTAPDAEGNPVSANDTKNDGIANTYSNGSLSVKKAVTGNMGDLTKEYQATVVFSYASGDDENCPIKSVISYTDGAAKTLEPSAWTYGSGAWTITATVSLAHDETVTFENIPYGVAYTVSEEDYSAEGYTHSFEFASNDSGSDTVSAESTAWSDASAAGTITDASDELTITNEKTTTIDVGVIVDSLPFIAAFTVAAAALVIVIKRNKRKADR